MTEQIRDIKKAHESFIINEFVEYLSKKFCKKIEILDWPDPPDAIISDGENTDWIEHCDAYRSGSEAKAELELASGQVDEARSRGIASPDRGIAAAIRGLIKKKFSKNSYKKVFNEHGEGILLINERDPLFDEESFKMTKQYVEMMNFESFDQGYFREVILVTRMPNCSTNQFVTLWHRSSVT